MRVTGQTTILTGRRPGVVAYIHIRVSAPPVGTVVRVGRDRGMLSDSDYEVINAENKKMWNRDLRGQKKNIG